ncbi:protein of unknown function [Bradyrhizobium vignae]|uniref:Uncharacterized protein n=1 Tax=Bradyrhizobium vignae TaxID=1549949 RepID=A0A2U3PWC9_9BRAD|nr:protein of unknown function [Bradyrhizobium vignae]
MESGGVVSELRETGDGSGVPDSCNAHNPWNLLHCVLQITAESRTVLYEDWAWPQTR